MYEGNEDYKFAAKHNVPLTSLVRPKMYVTGKLNTRYNSSMKTAISLIEPTFTSKLGQFYQEGYTSSKTELNTTWETIWPTAWEQIKTVYKISNKSFLNYTDEVVIILLHVWNQIQ